MVAVRTRVAFLGDRITRKWCRMWNLTQSIPYNQRSDINSSHFPIQQFTSRVRSFRAACGAYRGCGDPLVFCVTSFIRVDLGNIGCGVSNEGEDVFRAGFQQLTDFVCYFVRGLWKQVEDVCYLARIRRRLIVFFNCGKGCYGGAVQVRRIHLVCCKGRFSFVREKIVWESCQSGRESILCSGRLAFEGWDGGLWWPRKRSCSTFKRR
jgi:hypothetical protein